LRELMDDGLLDVLLERSKDQAGGLRLTGEGSMLGELVKAVLERALEAELTAHLGYGKGGRERPSGAGNYRNGAIAKTVQTGVGPVPLQVPRDRAGTFEPVLIPKRSGRIAGGLDDMIISLYAHGMSVRDIIHHLEQVYGTQLSHETVSRITDQVLEEVRAWQSRPLDPVRGGVPGRHRGQGPRQPGRAEQARLHRHRDRRRRGEARARDLAGQDPARDRDRGRRGQVLELSHDRPAQPRRPRHPDRLLRRAGRVRGRHHRGVHRHRGPALRRLVRNALRPVARRDAAAVAAGLRAIYTAPTAEAAFDALAEFAASPWGRKYPQAARVFEAAWEDFTPFLAFSPAVRKLLYTTNSIVISSLN
jgi:putative transposase